MIMPANQVPAELNDFASEKAKLDALQGIHNRPLVDALRKGDELVRRNPWAALPVALAAGLCAGLLLGKCRGK